MHKYRLLKDLPDVKAGRLFVWKDGLFVLTRKFGKKWLVAHYWNEAFMQEHPDWFMRVR